MNLFSSLNLKLIISTVLICCLSILVLFSFNPILARQQSIYFIAGMFCLLLLSNIDYKILKYFSMHFYLLIISLLFLTFIIGHEIRGSARWLRIASVNIQPSELSKVVLIVVLAFFFGDKVKNKLTFKTFVQSLLITTPIAVLVFIQPDLGTFIVLFFIHICLLLTLRPDKKYFFLAFILIGLLAEPLWVSLKDYQRNRVMTFINPTLDPQGSGYNVLQSIIAVGSGETRGKGFGFGTQSRLRFLPESRTDFIFASFAEEWGFIGSLSLFVLFFIMFWSILECYTVADDLDGKLICLGVFCFIFLHFFINVGMNLGLMPVTGIPLPFMSYGGSSLVSSFLGLGLVNSVWKRSKGKGY